MLKKTIFVLSIAAAAAAVSLSAWAQDKQPEPLPDNVPALLVRANSAFGAKDYLTFRRVMQRLHEMRPYNSDYMYQLVNAHALLNEKRAAYDLMVKMQQQGLAYDFSQSESTLNIRGTQVFDYINDLMKRAAQPMGESKLVLTLPQKVIMPEALAWDGGRQKFLVGTVRSGSVLATGKDGGVERLIEANDENRMWGVFGLLVDKQRNRLWVSTAATTEFAGYDPSDKGRSALLEYDLKTLKLLHRYPVPVDGRPHILGSMVLSPSGDIYIADRVLPFVFEKAAAEDKLKPVLATREMISLRGMAMQPDGRIMYLADRELGILVIDVASGRSGKLDVPANLNLGGIDGMYLWQNKLIIIQNGIKPQRVMRLQLDSTGTKVEAVRPLAVAQPYFDYPSFGTVVGKTLYYFGNSHWSGSEKVYKPVRVLQTDLDCCQDLVAPEMKKFLQELKKSGKAVPEALEKEANGKQSPPGKTDGP